MSQANFRNSLNVACIALLWSVVLLATPVQANTSMHIEGCEMAMRGTLGMQNDILTIRPATDSKTYVIDAEQNLSIDGKAVPLNQEQQAVIESYYYNVRSAIPMGVEMAAQGLELANIAVNEVFTQLLGPQDDMVVKLNELIAQIKTKVESSIYAPDGSIFIDPNASNQDDWTDPQWHAEFDAVLEETIQDFMGTILIAMGKALLFGDGEPLFEDFNPDALGQVIEEKMAANGNALAETSTVFCEIVRAAEANETSLATLIPEYADYNFITVEAKAEQAQVK